MTNRHKRTFWLAVVAAGLLTLGTGQAAKTVGRDMTRLERQVRRELVTLPYYGVFDNLAFRLDGDTVTLLGQVSRPSLRRDAERAVQRIEGVERLVNQIEVLPVSGHDDDLRLAAYRAICGHPALQRYWGRAVPPIHIIVKNGHVTLEGVVALQSDRDIYIRNATRPDKCIQRKDNNFNNGNPLELEDCDQGDAGDRARRTWLFE